MKIWHIEDGADHWVAAESGKRAVELLAKTTCESLEEYYEGIGMDQVGVSEWDKNLLVDVTDEGSKLLDMIGYPKGTRVKIELQKSEFSELEEGIVATSEV